MGSLIPLLTLFTLGCASAPRPTDPYPAHWWKPVATSEAASWEILPQAAGPGEVILSKRNELGLLSNFAATPFEFHGRRYASLEGFWQSLLYPEGPQDPRQTAQGLHWQHRRDEVAAMVAFEAKKAGSLAEANMRKMGIDWVTFEGRRMTYWTSKKGDHYDIIVAAMREKIRQNPAVRDVLARTGNLKLRPDHHEEPNASPAWRYTEIYMMLREEL